MKYIVIIIDIDQYFFLHILINFMNISSSPMSQHDMFQCVTELRVQQCPTWVEGLAEAPGRGLVEGHRLPGRQAPQGGQPRRLGEGAGGPGGGARGGARGGAWRGVGGGASGLQLVVFSLEVLNSHLEDEEHHHQHHRVAFSRRI